MKCPHCGVAFFSDFKQVILGEDREKAWAVGHQVCPSCEQIIIVVAKGYPNKNAKGDIVSLEYPTVLPAYPRSALRPAAPPEAPPSIAEDYNEACLILSDSPKAAAALGRRCLQAVLRDAAGVKSGDLANEIQQVLDAKPLPSHLAESIDAVRNIGNFAAHPTKSKHSGEIVAVEPGEAEWTLDVFESLFDFFVVQPELSKKKREALNKKLSEAGKPPMK